MVENIVEDVEEGRVIRAVGRTSLYMQPVLPSRNRTEVVRASARMDHCPLRNDERTSLDPRGKEATSSKRCGTNDEHTRRMQLG